MTRKMQLELFGTKSMNKIPKENEVKDIAQLFLTILAVYTTEVYQPFFFFITPYQEVYLLVICRHSSVPLASRVIF